MSDRPASTRFAVVLRWVLTVAVVAAIAVVLVRYRDILPHAMRLDLRVLAGVSALVILGYLLNAVAFKVTAARVGVRLTLAESMMLQLAVYTLNHLPMKSGTVLQGAIMRSRHGVRVADFVSLSAATQLMTLWSAGTIGGLFVVTSGAHPAALGWVMLVVPSAGLAALVAWGRAHRPGERPEPAGRVARMLVRAAYGTRELFGDVRLVLMLVAINIGIVLVLAVRMHLVFGAVGVGLGGQQSIVVAATGLFAYMFGLLPGGLGFREGGIAGAAAMVGVGSAVGLAAAVLDRAVDLVWVLLLGVPATLYLSRTQAAHPPEETPGDAA